MNKGFTKNEVRDALSDYIRKHAGTDRLPPLRDISRDLGVSIYLIRKNLNAMQREGILQSRNRIGMFLTPQKFQRQTIGIVFNPEWANPYIDFPDIYAGVVSSLAQRYYLIRNLSFKKLSDLPKLVKSLGLSGIVWIDQSANNLPVLMDRISLKHRIPLVLCGENLFLTRLFDKTTNTVSQDWEELAKLRADYFVSRGSRQVIYFAVNLASLKLFRAELARYGIILPDELVISQPDELRTRLPELIRKYTVDGILVDGGQGFYEPLFDFLHRHPGFKPLISIQDNPLVHYLLQQYSGIELSFQFESRHEFYYRLGERAAVMLDRAKTENLVQNSEKYTYQLKDHKFIQWKEENQKEKNLCSCSQGLLH